MSELYEAPESSSRLTPAVQWLLALNIGVYFLQLTLFGTEGVFSALALNPARFPGSWWTIATYMFVHAWLDIASQFHAVDVRAEARTDLGNARFVQF